ncbi:MAG: hypothetical protein JSW10_01740 [Pseudomonadota bacterium]|nr:MAG: hypothetical protein JSW10_01740 [Pseudomonadota bacterium]
MKVLLIHPFTRMREFLRVRAALRDRMRRKDAIVIEAIENVIDGTEPRIRLVPGYRKQLHQAVAGALAYVDALVEQIPEAIGFNKRAFGCDARVNAFFASADEMRQLFSASSQLRECVDAPDGCGRPECFALLCMRMEEKSRLGVELNGEIIKRDVPQTVVNFSEHKLLAPGATEQQVRQGLRRCMFDALVTHVLEVVLAERANHGAPEDPRQVLEARRRALHTRDRELAALLDSAQASLPIRAAVSGVVANAVVLTPQDYLQQVKELLSCPQDFVKLSRVTLNLTRLGVLSDRGDSAASAVQLVQIEIGEVLKRVVVLVRYPRAELLAPGDLLPSA